MSIRAPLTSLLNYTRIKFLPKSMRKFCIDVVEVTVEGVNDTESFDAT